VSPVLLGLMAGGALLLLLAPGAPPWRPTRLDRLYGELGAPAAKTAPRGGAVPLVRKLPVKPLVVAMRPLMSARYREQTERQLRLGGLAQTHTYDDLLGMKIAAALGCWLYVGLIMLKRPDPLLGLFLGTLGVLGFFGPDSWLKRKARLRQEQVRRELPSLLSATAIALEAGLHLMNALAEATRDRSGVLAGELQQAVAEHGRGTTPAEALERVAAWLEVAELTVTLTGLIQAFDKGSGHVVETVRAQAAEAWQRRRRQAETLAQTASVKLFLPLALLALPGFIIFLLGPALLEVLDFIIR
jgi:tight adherence protein C